MIWPYRSRLGIFCLLALVVLALVPQSRAEAQRSAPAETPRTNRPFDPGRNPGAPTPSTSPSVPDDDADDDSDDGSDDDPPPPPGQKDEYVAGRDAILAAAQQCTNPAGASCLRAHAVYYDCILSQLDGKATRQCVKPTCAASCSVGGGTANPQAPALPAVGETQQQSATATLNAALAQGANLLSDYWGQQLQSRLDAYQAARAEEGRRAAAFGATASQEARSLPFRPTRDLVTYVARGGSVNVRDERGNSLLANAASFGDLERVRFLLNAGADVELANARGETAIVAAAARYPNLVLLLASAGANPFHEGLGGHALNSVEDHAKFHDARELLALLRHFRSRDKKIGAALAAIAAPQPLDLEVVYAATHGDVGRLRELITDGANAHSTDGTGYMAIHHAVLRCEPEAVRTLLELGADANSRNWFQQTPLQLAVRLESNCKYGNLSAPDGAWLERQTLVISTLMKAGADPKLKDLAGDTAVEWVKRARKKAGINSGFLGLDRVASSIGIH